MIDKFANITINDTNKYLNRMNTSDVQVQFAGNTIRKTHQNVLSSRKIGIRHEEVPVLDPLTETIIDANNQPDFTISNVVVQSLKASKTHIME